MGKAVLCAEIPPPKYKLLLQANTNRMYPAGQLESSLFFQPVARHDELHLEHTTLAFHKTKQKNRCIVEVLLA